MLINNDTQQRDTVSERPIRPPLNHKAFGNLFCNSQKSFHTSPGPYDSNKRGNRPFFKLILINIFYMCLCIHVFIMVHHSLAFSRCMVDYTLMTDQMTTIFVFHFIWGHVPGGSICYQYSNRKDL